MFVQFVHYESTMCHSHLSLWVAIDEAILNTRHLRWTGDEDITKTYDRRHMEDIIKGHYFRVLSVNNTETHLIIWDSILTRVITKSSGL